MKLKIRVNDRVAIKAGKDKGKSGKVVQILPATSQVVVEGINVMFKHLKSRKKGEKGQRAQFNGPIAVSNVMVICPKCGRNTRLGVKLGVNKKRARFCKGCQEVID